MVINRYWTKSIKVKKNIEKKRHNKYYAGTLTIRNKRLREKRILAYMAIGFILIAFNAFADISYDYTVNAEMVKGTRPTNELSHVVEQVVMAEDKISAPLPVIVETETYEVSAYSEYDSCHYPKIVNGVRKCLVASGKIAEEGMIATNLYPFGTKIIIGGREFTVEDRISKRYNDRIDIFMGYGENGYDKAVNWGVKDLSIKVIK